MTLSLAVVCEADADRQTGCCLADRVVCREVKWIEPETLPHQRQWRGAGPSDPCLLWTDVKRLAAARQIKAHGHFDGRPGAHDAHAARLALLVLLASELQPDAFVLLRDDDGDAGRREGLEQARTAFPRRGRVVIGLARTKRECWVLAGFDPQGAKETAELDRLRRELGFDPREHADRHTAKHAPDKLSAKRVLGELTGGDHEREKACWRETDLDTLKRRGKESGLADYLREVCERIVPLFVRG